MLLDLLTVAVLGWVGSRLVVALRRSFDAAHRLWTRELVGGLRVHHFVLAVPVLALVLVTAIGLVQVPGLDFGWWTAIGGIGNPVVGGTERTSGTPLEWLVPLVFVVLLVPALPLLVTREEEMFRVGAESKTFAQRARRGAEFGLAHAIIGIPIGVALALSIGGWYFTWAYLRGVQRGGRRAGLLESARSHLAYNLTVLLIIALSLVAAACSSTGSGPDALPSSGVHLELTTTAFANGGTVPRQFTCDGADRVPPLSWSGVPSNAAAVYVVVADPDAPGGTFVHWVAGPLPRTATTVAPDAPSAKNDFGSHGYRGPCPPKGKGAHGYQFAVYATSRRVAIGGLSGGKAIGAIGKATVASAIVVGRYRR